MNIPYLAGPCRVHTIKMTYRRHSVMNITKPLIKYAYLWKLSERPSLGVPGVGVRWWNMHASSAETEMLSSLMSTAGAATLNSPASLRFLA